METQVLPAGTQVLESIQSFGQDTAAEAIQPANMRHGHDETSDNGLDCFCKVFVRPSSQISSLSSTSHIQQVEDQLLFCEGACKKWFHAWFVYYTSFYHYLSQAGPFIGAWGTLTAVPKYHSEYLTNELVIGITRPRTHECHRSSHALTVEFTPM